jgi:hypothetical protein
MDGMELERKPIFYSLLNDTAEFGYSPLDKLPLHLGGMTVLESTAIDAVFEPDMSGGQPAKPKPYTGGKTTHYSAQTQNRNGVTATDRCSDFHPEH